MKIVSAPGPGSARPSSAASSGPGSGPTVRKSWSKPASPPARLDARARRRRRRRRARSRPIVTTGGRRVGLASRSGITARADGFRGAARATPEAGRGRPRRAGRRRASRRRPARPPGSPTSRRPSSPRPASAGASSAARTTYMPRTSAQAGRRRRAGTARRRCPWPCRSRRPGRWPGPRRRGRRSACRSPTRSGRSPGSVAEQASSRAARRPAPSPRSCRRRTGRCAPPSATKMSPSIQEVDLRDVAGDGEPRSGRPGSRCRRGPA